MLSYGSMPCKKSYHSLDVMKFRIWFQSPQHTNMIGTKWIFKNKIDEEGNIARNKALLVSQGYTQVERVDFDETCASVACLESI